MNLSSRFRLNGNLIAASAGTGKTYQLTSRFVALLALGAEPQKMIALTFTEKAAGEFRNRIFQALADGALGTPSPEHKERNAMAVRVWETWTGLHLTPTWELEPTANPVALYPAAIPMMERAAREHYYPENLQPLPGEPQLPRLTTEFFARLLCKVINKAAELHLSTLDSFFNRVVAADLYKAGLSTVTPMNALQEQKARRTALLALLAAAESSADHQQALLTLFADISQEKGGSSLELLENNIKTYRSLYHEFPDASLWGNTPPFGLPDCREGRLLTQADFDAWDKEIQTAVSSLGWKGKRVHVKKSFGSLVKKLREGTFTPSATFAAWLQREEQMAPAVGDEAGDEALRSLVEEIRRACACLFLRKLQEKSGAMYELLQQYERAYRECVLQAGCSSFDDIKRGAARLLAEQENGADETLALRLVSRLDHWMLDEFQDTDPTQWAILGRLLKENAQFPDKSLFVVGDKKQSIYSFRGATSELFEQLRGALPTEDGYDWQKGAALANSTLPESRRSAPDILDFCNLLFRNIDEVDKEYSTQLTCAANRTKKGYVRVEMLPPGNAEETRNNTCEYVGRILDELSEELPDNSWRLLRGMTIAVLVRTRKEARQIAEWLRKNRPQLPTQLVEDTPVAEASPLGEMLLSFFLWLQTPADKYRQNLLRVSPLAGVMPESESATSAWCKWHHILDTEGYAAVIRRLAELIPHVAEDRMIREWFEAACDFDASGGSAEEWILYMRTLSNKSGGTPGCVQIMTMHKSKGAEFDAVILPYIASKNADQPKSDGIPSFLSEDKEGLLIHPGTTTERSFWPELVEAEERWKRRQREDAYNLMYVALTRARYANYILVPETEEIPEPGHKESDWILAALKRNGRLPAVHDAVFFGSDDWFEELREKKCPRAQSATIQPLGAVTPTYRKTRPSAEESPVSQPTNSGTSEGLRHSFAASQLGTEVHSLFEQISDWQESTAPTWYHTPQTKAEHLAAQALHQPAVQKLLSVPPGALVYNEQSLESTQGGEWCSATIDRLVLYPDGSATVVDYKTDRDTTRDAMLRAHNGQMQKYRELIAKALNIEPKRISVYLLAVRDGSIHAVE